MLGQYANRSQSELCSVMYAPMLLCFGKDPVLCSLCLCLQILIEFCAGGAVDAVMLGEFTQCLSCKTASGKGHLQ